MRWPGVEVEPGSIAWKATILTAIPPTPCVLCQICFEVCLKLLITKTK